MSRRAFILTAAWVFILGGFLASTVSAQVRWGDLGLESSAPMDSVAWRDALDLEGRPVAEAPLGPAILRGLRMLAASGYPFAEAKPSAFDLKNDRLHGTIVVTLGQRARIEGLILNGATVTRPRTALRLGGIEPGQLYTGKEQNRVRENLARSGLFQSVGDPEVLPGDSPEKVVFKIPVREPAYTRFTGVLGVSGQEASLTGLLDLDLANIGGTAREASGRWENRGDGLTRFALRYREPWLPILPIGLAGSLEHDVNEGVYSYTKWEITGDVEWAEQWRFRLGRGGTRAVETESEAGGIDESFIVAGLTLDRRNSALNPSAGFKIGLDSRRGKKTFTPIGDTLRVRLDRTRWEAEAEGYRRFGQNWLGVLRARFLFLDTPEDSIPRWDLFAVGGAATLRGYREEQFLTPAAWILKSEWRWIQDARGSALYLFADAGLLSPRAGEGLRDSFREFVLGTGVGVRQANRIGVFGVEYGIAKGESPLDGRIHLRLDAVF